MNMKLLFLFPLFTISACGGGSSSSDQPIASPTSPEIFTGQFVDSAVQGLTYSTASQSGITNENGEFKYQSGEAVTFSIGGIVFPEVPSASLLTPLDVFNTDDVDDQRVSNLARLLQSLDVDGNADNGIEISEQSRNLASEISIDFSSNDLSTQVGQLLVNSAGVHQSLISAEQAKYHLQTTLGIDLPVMNDDCTSVNAKVGYSGNFQTLAHNVSGSALINDDCTITISNFDYDGGGPDVFVYAGVNGNFAEGFKISDKLNGREYNSETLVLTLPDGYDLDDLTGLSIWCVDFNANFGDLEFTP